MGIKRNISILASAVALCLSFQAQAQPRSLDRSKWKELKREIDKRRYDAHETITEHDVQRENRTHYDNENANKWAKDHPRMQDPNRKSDYSHSDHETNSDGSEYGNGDGTGGFNSDGNGSPYGNNGNEDADIFDDNSGTGNDAEDELGNSTWDDEYEGADGRGDAPYETPDRNSFEVDPPRINPRSSPSGSGGLSTTLMYVLLGVLIAVALFFILRSIDWKNKKVKKQAVVVADPFETLEFTKTELELAIEKALAEGNFREAVRIYFLAVVKELRDKGLIKWEKKKTNYAYLNEMLSHPQFNRFEFATRIFEVVWYGNRRINREEFHAVEPVYKGLLQDIVRA